MNPWGGRKFDQERQNPQVGPAEGTASGATRKKLHNVHRESVGKQAHVQVMGEEIWMEVGKLSNIIEREGRRLLP